MMSLPQAQVPSNPSSEVSIEEIGAEEELAQCEKDVNAHEVRSFFFDMSFLSEIIQSEG